MPPEVIGAMILDAPDLISDEDLLKMDRRNMEQLLKKKNQDVQ